LLKQVKAGDFAPPRHVQPAAPAALEAVCLKAMSHQPADRYGSARELAEEVERWLADEPVRAWPEPWTVKTRRWTNQHRVLLSSAAACLIVALIGSIAGTLLLSEANEKLEKSVIANMNLAKANEETAIANKNLAKANEETAITNEKLFKDQKNARDRAEELLATSTMMLARSRFEANHAALAEDLLEQVPAKFRFPAWGLLKNYVAGSLFTLRGHTQVTSVAFAADGLVLASASWDGTVKLWAARTGQELRTLRGHKALCADMRTGSGASRLCQTARCWPRRAPTRRSGCGTREPARNSAFCAGIRTLSGV
jgi:hypothetical protein